MNTKRGSWSIHHLFFICYNKAMTKSKIFLTLSLSFIFGIFAQSFWEIDLWLVYLLAVAPIIAIAINYRNKIILISGFAILFLVLGIWLVDRDLNKLDNLDLNGKSFEGLVIVEKEPEIRENYQKIVAKVVLRSRTPKSAKILVNVPLHADIAYGDEITVNCNLKIPENKSRIGPATSSFPPTGGSDSARDEAFSFDYKMYLAKDGIYYLCEKAKIEKTGRNKGNKIYIAILKLKNNLEKNLSAVIPEPEVALAKGLIIGGSSQLPQKIQENFGRTGMSHIVAVSGYNVTIIAEYLIWFFIFIGFWRRQAFWFAIIGIIIFVAMTGFPSSAVRAGVMGSLLLWAMKNGRLANSYNAIIFAGSIMLAINPLALRWDIGFQLSFLAALGIIVFAPFWEKIFIKQHKALGFSEIFFLSLSAQIFVLPVVFYNFHIFSAVSLIANLLVLPLIPLSMLLVFLCAVAGFIFHPLSLVLAWLAYLPLKYEIWVINTLASLDWSSMEIKNFGWQGTVLWYILLAAVIYLLKNRKKAMQNRKFRLVVTDGIVGDPMCDNFYSKKSRIVKD